MNWSLVKLEDVSDYRIEKIDSKLIAIEDYLSTDNILPNRQGIELSRYPPTTKKVSHYRRNDILVSNIRPYFKKIWFADKEGGCSNDVIVFKTKSKTIYPKFLYYQLSQDSFFDFVMAGSNGTKMPRGNKKSIRNFKFLLPPFVTQKRIADILSTYDDLIENNLKRIKLLEQAAHTIYIEWFVNMRFPGYEEAKFDSETGLPEGWTLGDISDYGTVITGKTPSTKKDEYYGGGIPFIKTPDIHSFPYVIQTSLSLSAKGSDSQRNKVLPENSVLVSCIGTAGVVGLISRPSQTNQQINAVKFDKEFKPFYFYCFAKGLKKKLEALGSNGATMVNVNKSKFEGIKILIPSDAALVSYHKMVQVNFKLILNLQKQIQSLKQARDILLPRLMNQTIEV